MRGDHLLLVPTKEGDATLMLSDLGRAVDIADVQAAVVVRSYGEHVSPMLWDHVSGTRFVQEAFMKPEGNRPDGEYWTSCAEYMVARGMARWIGQKEGFAMRVLLIFVTHGLGVK